MHKNLRVMDSLLCRNAGILSLDQIRTLSYNWNKGHCDRPIDYLEFEHQWNSAVKFICSQIKTEEEKKENRKEQKKKQNVTKAVDALEVIRSKCLELFVDQIGEPYGAIKVRDHIETIPIRSNNFRIGLSKPIMIIERNNNRRRSY